MRRVVTCKSIFLVRLRRFFLTSDTIEISCLVFSCRNLNKLSLKFESYSKSKKKNIYIYIYKSAHSDKKCLCHCSNCNKLTNINYPFSLEAVECEHLLFCWQAVILISYDHVKETWFHCLNCLVYYQITHSPTFLRVTRTNNLVLTIIIVYFCSYTLIK